MYCTTIWDLDSESCVRFYWSSTAARARRLAGRYRRVLESRHPGKFEVFVEGAGSSYNLDDACGYNP